MTTAAITAPGETALFCAQCGRPAPADPSLLVLWRNSSLQSSPVDELIVMMLLCPDCLDEDHDGAFESGEGD